MAKTEIGLGLAIARWIAEAHHGRLTLVQSDVYSILPANGAAAAESTDATHSKRESTS